jgi:hypothetical protein
MSKLKIALAIEFISDCAVVFFVAAFLIEGTTVTADWHIITKTWTSIAICIVYPNMLLTKYKKLTEQKEIRMFLGKFENHGHDKSND